jgi:NAD(P)H-hydrate epimerase
MGVAVQSVSDGVDLPPADLIIDTLIGNRLSVAPTGAMAMLIQAANNHRSTVLALDIPSGVDVATGTVYDSAIRAAATLMLALPKHGLSNKTANWYVGDLYRADLGVPTELYVSHQMDLRVDPIFAKDDILRLR